MQDNPGLFFFRPSQHKFTIVTAENFKDMIISIPHDQHGNMIRIDTKLKDSCDLVNYYLPMGLMPLFRLLGCTTPQVAYISQDVHFVHDALVRLYKQRKSPANCEALKQ